MTDVARIGTRVVLPFVLGVAGLLGAFAGAATWLLDTAPVRREAVRVVNRAEGARPKEEWPEIKDGVPALKASAAAPAQPVRVVASASPDAAPSVAPVATAPVQPRRVEASPARQEPLRPTPKIAEPKPADPKSAEPKPVQAKSAEPKPADVPASVAAPALPAATGSPAVAAVPASPLAADITVPLPPAVPVAEVPAVGTTGVKAEMRPSLAEAGEAQVGQTASVQAQVPLKAVPRAETSKSERAAKPEAARPEAAKPEKAAKPERPAREARQEKAADKPARSEAAAKRREPARETTRTAEALPASAAEPERAEILGIKLPEFVPTGRRIRENVEAFGDALMGRP